MYPDPVGIRTTPRAPVTQGVGAGTASPAMGPPSPARQTQDRTGEIYNRYLAATKQDTSLDSLIPVMYRLRLEKIARKCHKLEIEVLAMGKYESQTHSPASAGLKKLIHAN